MCITEQEKVDEYIESLPKTDEDFPDWDKAPHGEDGFPVLPKLSMDEYLRLKYPEADEEELRTDMVRDKHGLEEALRIDRTCASCASGDAYCLLTKSSKHPKGGRPIVMLKNGALQVVYTTCMRCKHDKSKPDPEFEQRVKRSGLSEQQNVQTFAAYEHEGMLPEVVSAKAKAILAAKHRTNLILAGKPGTGKTHLAAAIALEVMRGGKQAIFRTVPDLLSELWSADWNHTGFFGLCQKYREVPCLVLDDWGKEKPTEKKLEYLYQIIDYRYQHGLQTIVTTNAQDMVGLMNGVNADKIEALVSRILSNGEWVTISSAENYRLTPKAATKYEEYSGNEEKCANFPMHEAVQEEKILVPTNEIAESEVISAETVDVPITASDPEREKCHSLEEIVMYAVKHGKMPPEYEELGQYDRELVAVKYMEQTSAKSVVPKKPERDPLYDDEDFWKEDEDEYRLYGETGIPGRDYDEEEEDENEDPEMWK